MFENVKISPIFVFMILDQHYQETIIKIPGVNYDLMNFDRCTVSWNHCYQQGGSAMFLPHPTPLTLLTPKPRSSWVCLPICWSWLFQNFVEVELLEVCMGSLIGVAFDIHAGLVHWCYVPLLQVTSYSVSVGFTC